MAVDAIGNAVCVEHACHGGVVERAVTTLKLARIGDNDGPTLDGPDHHAELSTVAVV